MGKYPKDGKKKPINPKIIGIITSVPIKITKALVNCP
jgi:hypothetical protein|tara:strand:- start:895 stop:1005 length:111 start_codon:yes stop_codon:yes gene_type:complete